jgi:hypothetical protein
VQTTVYPRSLSGEKRSSFIKAGGITNKIELVCDLVIFLKAGVGQEFLDVAEARHGMEHRTGHTM